MSLSASPISELALETTTLNVWAEFLGLWFNGATHVVGANSAVLFPQVTLRFQQSQLPQPLSGENGVAITMTWNVPGTVKLDWDRGQQMALGACTWLFWIRAAGANFSTGGEKVMCRTVGERLFALLQNNHATRDLHEKGIHHLRPRPPQLIAEGGGGDAAFSMRMVTCRGQLKYQVKSQV